MSFLSLTEYIHDVHASKVSPICAITGTGPHSLISGQLFQLSCMLWIWPIQGVTKLRRYALGYRKVE